MDQHQVIRPDYDDDEAWSWKRKSIEGIRQAYGDAFIGLNFIGMVDASLYVSVQWTFGVSRLVRFHVHALVWGIERKDLDDALKGGRYKGFCYLMRPLLPYASSVDIRRVKDGDLLQMIWYMTKMPRKQYQVWSRKSDDPKRSRRPSYQQQKRNINGVNSVRLLAAMRDVRLDQLALSGGEGDPILQRVLRDAKRW